MHIELKRTTDILAFLGEHKKAGQVICGFSMETENMIENSTKKLEKKKVDMIAANSLREAGAGFGTDTNHIIVIEKDGMKDLGMVSKAEAAHKLLDRMLSISKNGGSR